MVGREGHSSSLIGERAPVGASRGAGAYHAGSQCCEQSLRASISWKDPAPTPYGADIFMFPKGFYKRLPRPIVGGPLGQHADVAGLLWKPPGRRFDLLCPLIVHLYHGHECLPDSRIREGRHEARRLGLPARDVSAREVAAGRGQAHLRVTTMHHLCKCARVGSSRVSRDRAGALGTLCRIGPSRRRSPGVCAGKGTPKPLVAGSIPSGAAPTPQHAPANHRETTHVLTVKQRCS